MVTDQDTRWLETLLGVSTPWQISEVRLTGAKRAVSIQIEQADPAKRFWPVRKPSAFTRRLRWDHVSLAGRRCEIVLMLREGQGLPDAPWTGEADMPFTRGLSRLLLDLMLEGATMAQLCKLLDLSFSDLWKFKFRLDQGQGQVKPTSARLASSAPAVDATINNAPAAATVPAETSPVWLSVLTGQLNLDVQALSLKLLLSKLLREASQHSDRDLHMQAAASLQRYFLRHQAMLGHEIKQLAQADRRMPAAPAGHHLPDVSDPLWLALLQGDCELDVHALSLRLLLTKLRSQARAALDDDVRMLKLVELHRYFEKHQGALRHEIAQLQRWSVH